MNIQVMDDLLRQMFAKPGAVVGVCEMETDTWACGNSDYLTEGHVRTWIEGDQTELRWLCSSCRDRFAK